MKYCIFLLFISTPLFSQQVEGLSKPKKNSLGLSITAESIGGLDWTNESPSFRLDYRRLLNSNYELRASLGYQISNSSIYNSSSSFSLGLNRYLYKSPKIEIYGVADIEYSNSPTINGSSLITEPLDFRTIHKLGFSLSLGMEFKLSSRLGLLIEPNLLNFSFFDSIDGQSSFQTDKLRTLKGTHVGMRYRF